MFQIIRSLILKQLKNKTYWIQVMLCIVISMVISIQFSKSISILQLDMAEFMLITINFLINLTNLFILLSFVLSNGIMAEKATGRLEFLVSNKIGIKNITFVYSVATFISCVIPVIICNITFILCSYIIDNTIFLHTKILQQFGFKCAILLLFCFALSFFLNYLSILLYNYQVLKIIITFMAFIFSFGGSNLLNFLMSRNNINISDLHLQINIVFLGISIMLLLGSIPIKYKIKNENLIIKMKD